MKFSIHINQPIHKFHLYLNPLKYIGRLISKFRRYLNLQKYLNYLNFVDLIIIEFIQYLNLNQNPIEYYFLKKNMKYFLKKMILFFDFYLVMYVFVTNLKSYRFDILRVMIRKIGYRCYFFRKNHFLG